MNGAPAPDRSSAVSPLARRLGPIVAAVGVVGALVTVALIAWGPTNIEGTVAAADVSVPAMAVVGEVEARCVVLVDGTGERDRRCDPALPLGGAPWFFNADGSVVLSGVEGEVALDPETGEVTTVASGQSTSRPPRGLEDRQRLRVDGGRVVDADDRDRVLLDVGGLATPRLESVSASPDGTWAVAVASDGRVLAARTSDPATVWVWFELEDDRLWFDAIDAVRWNEAG